ncbi:MAG: hypothetical protein AAF741_13795 [Bacteroidota bacterium]
MGILGAITLFAIFSGAWLYHKIAKEKTLQLELKIKLILEKIQSSERDKIREASVAKENATNLKIVKDNLDKLEQILIKIQKNVNQNASIINSINTKVDPANKNINQ